MEFKRFVENQDIVNHFDNLYKRAGKFVDGREVLPDIPNTSSISSSLNEYEILPVVRDFPIYGFGGKKSYYSGSDQKRVEMLAAQIDQSKKISPIIIVEEKDGPYVLEGGHRIAALVELKAKSIPALIVIDMESFS